LKELRGRLIEAHAGAAYVEPLRVPLAARAARLTVPPAHLWQGEQLAWYKAGSSSDLSPAPASTVVALHDPIADMVRLLSDPALALSPEELIARGRDGLQVPGLYSWWVDEEGAADLSRGLGQPVTAGLIYAGEAGATRWPSGRQSASTLWSRITGMHLGSAAEFSTFRRTLAAILGSVLGMISEDDPRLFGVDEGTPARHRHFTARRRPSGSDRDRRFGCTRPAAQLARASGQSGPYPTHRTTAPPR
jgi:hypothetical protein